MVYILFRSSFLDLLQILPKHQSGAYKVAINGMQMNGCKTLYPILVKSGQVKSGQFKLGQVKSKKVKSKKVNSGQVNLGQV